MSDEIRVATLNLRNRQDRWLQRRKLVVAELLDSTPDLVSLQEISLLIGQGRWLRNQINSRLTGSSKQPYHLVQKGKQHYYRGFLEGIGILSKLPILSHDSIDLGYGGRVALRVNVELPSRHTLDFVTTHLHHVAEDIQAREEQVMKLIGWLNERNPVPLQVIAGDFNEIPTGLAIQRMKQKYRSAYEEVWGHDPLATFPTALVSLDQPWAGCLDYIFVSTALDEVLEANIFCSKPAPDDPTLYPSDHVGLLATIKINSRERLLRSADTKPGVQVL